MAKRTKATRGSKKAARSTRTRSTPIKNGPVPPYGDAIRNAIESGQIGNMRRVAASARKWLEEYEKRVQDVRQALSDLEQAIKDLGR